MADDLLSIGKEVQGPLQPKEQTLARAGMNASEPAPRGDDLLARAEAMSDFSEEEKSYIKLFSSSRRMLDQKVQQDPGYAEALIKRLQGKQGDALADATIDEADNLRIEFLKQNDPRLFNEGSAGVSALLNEASFGQLTRIYGKLGETIQGRPYEEVVQEQAERLRLLEKAFPGSSMVGKAAAYLIPGSPVKSLFTKAAAGATKVAGAIIPRIVANPSLAAKALQVAGNATVSAAGAGAGAAATEGVKGFLGEGTQGISLDRGMDDAYHGGLMGALTGGAVPIAGAVIGETARALAPAVNRVAKRVDAGLGALVEQATGVPEEALRAYRVKGAAIRSQAGKEGAIGDDLLDFLQSAKRSKLPEIQQAESLLPQLPAVDVSRTLKYLRGAGKTTAPESEAVSARLSEWADRIEKQLPLESSQGYGGLQRAGKISATKARDLVDDMQAILQEKGAYGKYSGEYLAGLKVAARTLRQTLVETAKTQGGAEGQLYGELMQRGASRVGVLKYIGKQLGRSEEQQLANAEKFVDRIFGNNRTYVQSRLGELDAKFGTNFLERAQNSQYAQQLGKGGVPGILPAWKTGAASKATQAGATFGGTIGTAIAPGLGTAVGAAIGGAIGSTVASPRAGAAILGTSSNITGFVRRMAANPEALARIKSLPATPFGIPIEVRKIADEMQKTFVKDGPVSAGGVARLVADTPFFLGLVHAFDVAEKDLEKKNKKSAVEKLSRQ